MDESAQPSLWVPAAASFIGHTQSQEECYRVSVWVPQNSYAETPPISNVMILGWALWKVIMINEVLRVAHSSLELVTLSEAQ